jgi:nitrogen regulatory protein P-II 1
MKEIKAYVHRSRIADVIAAEGVARLGRRTRWPAPQPGHLRRQGLAASAGQQRAALLDGPRRRGVNEYKLELLCEDSEVEPLKPALVAAARTGQAVAGWITVIDVISATPIH